MKTFDELLTMTDEEITAYRLAEVDAYIRRIKEHSQKTMAAFQETIEASIAEADDPMTFCGNVLFQAKSLAKENWIAAQELKVKVNQELNK